MNKDAAAKRMNPNEMALNRPLLRAINEKLKGQSQYDAASNAAASGVQQPPSELAQWIV